MNSNSGQQQQEDVSPQNREGQHSVPTSRTQGPPESYSAPVHMSRLPVNHFGPAFFPQRPQSSVSYLNYAQTASASFSQYYYPVPLSNEHLIADHRESARLYNNAYAATFASAFAAANAAAYATANAAANPAANAAANDAANAAANAAFNTTYINTASSTGNFRPGEFSLFFSCLKLIQLFFVAFRRLILEGHISKKYCLLNKAIYFKLLFIYKNNCNVFIYFLF